MLLVNGHAWTQQRWPSDPKAHALPKTRAREHVCRITDVFCIKVISPSQHQSFLHPKPVSFPLSVVVLPCPWSPAALHVHPALSNFPVLPNGWKPRLHHPHTLATLSPSTTLVPTTVSAIVAFSLFSLIMLHNNTQTFHQALIFSGVLFLPGFAASDWTIALMTLSPLYVVYLHLQLFLWFWSALHFLFHSVLPCSSHSRSSSFLPIVFSCCFNKAPWRSFRR